MGVIACPLLLILSFSLAIWLSIAYQNFFVGWLSVYFGLTCLYSFYLKRLILVDCIVLAMLYTLRVIAGAAAIDQPLSFWLLCFSVFLFLSLAFIKRYAELLLQTQSNKLNGRAYLKSDAPLIQQFGVMSAYACVLVLALYLNSHEIVMLYPSPKFVWGALTVMLFWVSWMWLKAHRGQMHDDPLVFAIKDRISIIAGVLFILSLVLGAGGWSWLSHTLLNL
jgi:4-hydroxybenzoate polyprenyltransferase